MGIALALPAFGASGVDLPAEMKVERQCLDHEPRVCLVTQRDRRQVRFDVDNGTEAHQSVRLAPSQLENLSAARPLPFRAVVPPGQTRRIGVLATGDPRGAFGYQLAWSAAPGSMLARHDDGVRYAIPFGGDEPRPLTQGPNGRFSHTGIHRYAFDFAMPFGTPILAARAGTVIRVKDGSIRALRRLLAFGDANAVDVAHPDGTVATYAHLRRGIVVAPGDSVAVGDTLGFSGDTGFSTGPHLHFMVWRRKQDLSAETLPVRFDDGTAQGFVPVEGTAYGPACAGDRAECMARSRSQPAAPPARTETTPTHRRPDGACVCANGAVIRVEGLACVEICGG